LQGQQDRYGVKNVFDDLLNGKLSAPIYLSSLEECFKEAVNE
jgi:hypothetical protein